MAKRISDAERVIGFFRTAPVETAQVILDLAKAEVKSRRTPATVHKVRPARPVRTPEPEEVRNVA